MAEKKVTLKTKIKRILTFVGALIVFSTFVVNESKIAKYKEAAGLIDRAQDIFNLRSDIHFMNRRLVLVDEEIKAVRSVLDRQGSKGKSVVIDLSEMDKMVNDEDRPFLEESLVSLDTTSRLLELLPPDQAQLSKMKTLESYANSSCLHWLRTSEIPMLS
jgi:hypothetical protein